MFSVVLTPKYIATLYLSQTVSTKRKKRLSEVTVSLDEDPSDGNVESDGEVDPNSDDDWTPLDDLIESESDHGSDFSDEEPVAPANGCLCTDCGKFYFIRGRHKCEHITKPHPCNICGKRFVTEKALDSHGKVHDGRYQHLCKYCYVTFKTKADKLDHEKTHEDQEKPFKCPHCPETFTSFNERKVHLVDHRGPPKLKCDICRKKFVQPDRLQRHLLVHSGATPFECSVCQRRFNQASHLKSHVRLHTGERPFKCQHCDKTFNHNVSLKSHVQNCHSVNSDSEQEDLSAAKGSGTECSAGVVRRTTVPIFKRKSTGRPLGRPKRSALDSSMLTVQTEDQL